jgi:hypothetical protein
MTYKFKNEIKKRQLEEAKAELKKTLSGKEELEQTRVEELEAARLKFIKENAGDESYALRGESYALRKAKKKLEQTLSQNQIDQERL